jgi:rRNA-processing protein FCF1
LLGIAGHVADRRAPLRLRQDAQAGRALETLTDLITGLRNLPGELSGRSDSFDYIHRRRDHYLQWVENAEQMLSNHIALDAAHQIFNTPRYRRICDIDIHTARPIPLLNAEIESQQQTLGALRDDLARRLTCATAESGHITVLDTNTLEHFQLPDSIDWQKHLGHDRVRLIIPPTVIDELERHKQADSKRLRERARNVLPKLLQMVAQDGSPKAIREGITLEILLEQALDNSADADGEILATCAELALLSGQSVTLVSDDARLRLRATRQGLHAIPPPEHASRDAD